MIRIIWAKVTDYILTAKTSTWNFSHSYTWQCQTCWCLTLLTTAFFLKHFLSLTCDNIFVQFSTCYQTIFFSMPLWTFHSALSQMLLCLRILSLPFDLVLQIFLGNFRHFHDFKNYQYTGDFHIHESKHYCLRFYIFNWLLWQHNWDHQVQYVQT